MRHAMTALSLALALAVSGCGRYATSTDVGESATPTTGTRTQLLRFTYHPTAGDATEVALWFSGDAVGTLVAVRSSRREVRSGRLLQETSYRADGKYSIVDHLACIADTDVEPPTVTTASALVADSVGPLDAVRPTADIDDGQVLMHIAQPTPELSSRVVGLVDSATKEPVARLDGISLTEATAPDVETPLQPLRCTPTPSPAS